MQKAVSGGIQPQPTQYNTMWHVGSTSLFLLLLCSRFGPHLHSSNSILVHQYASSQHMKMPKHFLYIHYMDVESNQLSNTASTNTLSWHYVGSTSLLPQFSKYAPHLHRSNSVRALQYSSSQHMKVLKHLLHIHYMDMWKAVSVGIQP